MFRRFALYFLGVFLGLIMVVVIFGKRLDVLKAWLPQPRIKAEIIEKYQSDQIPPCFADANLGQNFDDFIHFIEDAHVDFASMIRDGNSRSYKVYKEEDASDYLQITLNDSTCSILSASVSNQEFICP